MARASQTTQPPTLYKIDVDLTEPTGDGDVIDAGTRLLVVNNSASSINITVEATAAIGGLDAEDLVAAVGAGDTVILGPFPKGVFGQPSGANESGASDQGRVYVDYSAVADVDRAVIPG